MFAARFLFGLAAFLSCGDPYASTPPSTSSAPSGATTRAPTTDVPASTAAVAPAPAAADLPLAGEIAYVEQILGGADGNSALPMIVAIHGLGDDPRNFSHLFDNFTEPARLILPRGLSQTQSGGWSWFPIRARDPDVHGLARGIDTAADRLAVAIAELSRARPTLGKPIVTGFSQGGMLSFALAVDHPDVIGVALPVGGWLPPPLWPKSKPTAAPPPIVAFHGTDDGAVAHEPTKACVDQLAQLGWPATLRSYPGVGHLITPELHRDLDDVLVDAVRTIARNKRKPDKATAARTP